MKFPLTIIFLLITPFLFAQVNLVPNPSFEQFDTCPNYFVQFDNYVKLWFNPSMGNPDYYNSCSSFMNVPSNYMGFQSAKSGVGYAGLYFYYPLNYREYIEIQLLDSLTSGTKYYISFWAALCDSCNISTDRLSLAISNDSLLNDTTVLLYFTPQINNPIGNYIIDRTNWVKISGTYVAYGGERFLSIGNFNTDSNTNIFSVTGGGTTDPVYDAAYYYIDDVCVSIDSLTCYEPVAILENNSKSNSINIFPNPATNELNLDCALTDKSYFELFDMLGAKRKVVTLDIGSQTKRIDLTGIDSGLYFYSVVDWKGNRIKTGKLVVIK